MNEDKKLTLLDKKDEINKEPKNISDELGYFKISIDKLPSKGLFYPEDIYIGLKPATVKEIRHWSMIDENDEYSFVEAIDFILDRTCLIKSKNKKFSKDDLCEVDRLYLIFYVRELTFNDNSNAVYIDVPYTYNGEEFKDNVVITKETLNYFEIPKKLMNFYSEKDRAFKIKGDLEFNVKLPSIGISSWVQKYLEKKIKNNKPIDEFFAKISSFILSDYKNMTDKIYFDAEVNSNKWSINDVSALDRVTQFLSKGAKQGFKHITEHGGKEVIVPLVFRNGIKSIFIVSDILGEFE